MSSEKFLEINSTYRDRSRYQNPANFIITPNNMINNISKAYPIYNFQSPTWNLMNVTPSIPAGQDYWDDFKINSKIGGSTNPEVLFNNGGHGNLNMNGTGSNCEVSLDGVSNINSSIDGQALPTLYDANSSTAGPLQGFKQSSTEDDYYRGMFLQIWKDDTNNTYIDNSPLSSSMIISYKGSYDDDSSNYRGPGYYSCKLDCSVLSGSISNNNVWTINWGGGFNKFNNHVISYKNIHVNGGSDIKNFYKGFYIENLDLDITDQNTSSGLNLRMKKIKSYDGKTCRAVLEDNDDGTVGFEDMSNNKGFQTGNRFRIREEKPILMGWGSLEPLEGARPTPIHSLYNTTIGSDPFSNDQTVEQAFNSKLNSGIGRLNCTFGVYEFDIINGGTGFNGPSFGEALFSDRIEPLISNTLINTLSSQRIAIIVTQLGNNGSITKGKIAYPGFFQQSPLTHRFNIKSPTGGNDAIIVVKSVRPVVDLNPIYWNNSNHTGELKKVYGAYNNKILYISSKYESYKSKNNRKLGALPCYYQQFPNKYSNIQTSDLPSDICRKETKPDDTGCARILLHTWFNPQNAWFGEIQGIDSFVNNNSFDNGNTFEYNKSGTVYFKDNGLLTMTNSSYLILEESFNPVNINDELTNTVPVNVQTEVDSWTQPVALYWNNLFPESNLGWGYDTPSIDTILNNQCLHLRDAVNFEIQNISSTVDGMLDYKTIINERNTKYRLNLKHIILPNININSKMADSFSQIPYIYVQLTSTTNTYDTTTKTVSNNRKLGNGVFKVLSSGGSGKFIKLSSTTNIHDIVINRKSELHFRIFLENDEDLLTNTTDNFLPAYPNDNVQISANFQLTEIK